MKTNGLPHLVKYEIYFDYSSALQRFYNLSKLAVACRMSPVMEIVHTCVA